MSQFNRPLALGAHLVLRPPAMKLRAYLPQSRDKRGKLGVPGSRAGPHTKQREQCLGVAFPVYGEPPQFLVGEVIPEHVALHWWQRLPLRNQRLGAIPGQHVPALIANMGGIWLKSGQ